MFAIALGMSHFIIPRDPGCLIIHFREEAKARMSLHLNWTYNINSMAKQFMLLILATIIVTYDILMHLSWSKIKSAKKPGKLIISMGEKYLNFKWKQMNLTLKVDEQSWRDKTRFVEANNVFIIVVSKLFTWKLQYYLKWHWQIGYFISVTS